MPPALDRYTTRLESTVKRHKDALSLLLIIWVSLPNLAAIRLFWDYDVLKATLRMNEGHLFFFDAAMMILMAAIVTRRLTLPVFAIAFALAATPDIQWLIDIGLHGVLNDAGVFRRVFGPASTDQVPNVRSAKVILFAVLTPVLAAQVLLPRTRSIDRTFALMGTLAITLTTFLFHAALPGGVMRFAQRDAMYVARYAAVAEPDQVVSFCNHLDSRCTRAGSRAELMEQLRAAGLENLANQIPSKPDGAVISTLAAAVVGEVDGRRHLKPMLVVTRVPKEGETTILLLEERQPMLIDRGHARSFAFLGITAHGFWTLFIMALCALHHWRGRGRLFRPAQRA